MVNATGIDDDADDDVAAAAASACALLMAVVAAITASIDGIASVTSLGISSLSIFARLYTDSLSVAEAIEVIVGVVVQRATGRSFVSVQQLHMRGDGRRTAGVVDLLASLSMITT